MGLSNWGLAYQLPPLAKTLPGFPSFATLAALARFAPATGGRGVVERAAARDIPRVLLETPMAQKYSSTAEGANVAPRALAGLELLAKPFPFFVGCEVSFAILCLMVISPRASTRCA